MRIYNYTAFYVAEPFNTSSLSAYATYDFCYYQMLKAWKAKDNDFPFFNAHSTTYNVRDGSGWEFTLKPRLRERLRNSKNIILILSSNTKNSRAFREEIDYGINTLGLPVIIIYPEYSNYDAILDRNCLKNEILNLINNLPILRESKNKVPVLHIPMNKELITKALNDKRYTIQHAISAGDYKLR